MHKKESRAGGKKPPQTAGDMEAADCIDQTKVQTSRAARMTDYYTHYLVCMSVCLGWVSEYLRTSSAAVAFTNLARPSHRGGGCLGYFTNVKIHLNHA